MRGFFYASSKSVLQRLNVGSLLALRACGHFERNALIFLERLESVALNRREMREQIFTTAIRSDKAKTFGVIEPFYNTSCH